MALQESGEMYLESIYVLLRRDGRARAVDVSEYMNFSKPSVSRALGLLREGGYLLTDHDGYLTLTEAGEELASKIYERHTILTRVLTSLGVGEETAAEDACKIEHDISDETFEAIRRYLDGKTE